MTKHELNKELDRYKTLCCESTWHRHAKLDYRCDECDRDVSVEIITFLNAINY